MPDLNESPARHDDGVRPYMPRGAATAPGPDLQFPPARPPVPAPTHPPARRIPGWTIALVGLAIIVAIALVAALVHTVNIRKTIPSSAPAPASAPAASSAPNPATSSRAFAVTVPPGKAWTNEFGTPDASDVVYAMAIAPDGTIVTVESAPQNQTAVAAYSPDGSSLWTTPTQAWLNKVAVASDGTIIAAGALPDLAASREQMTTIGKAYIVALSPKGTVLWSKTMGGSDTQQFLDVSIAGDGTIAAVGYTFSRDGDFPVPPDAPSDRTQFAMAASFKPTGDVNWVKAYYYASDVTEVALTNAATYFAAGTVAPDGSLVVIRNSLAYGAGYFLEKMSPSGDLVWRQHLPSWTTVYSCDVVTDASGAIFMSGSSSANADDLYPNYPQAAVAKFTADGTRVWFTTVGGTEDYVSQWASFSDLALAPDGSLVAVGTTNYRVDAPPHASHVTLRPPSTGLHAGSDNLDALAARISPDGTMQWAYRYGGSWDEVFDGIAVTAGNNPVVAGYNSSSDGDFPPPTGVAPDEEYPSPDAIVAQLNPDGTLAPR